MAGCNPPANAMDVKTDPYTERTTQGDCTLSYLPSNTLRR
jgi:hypothetical protein